MLCQLSVVGVACPAFTPALLPATGLLPVVLEGRISIPSQSVDPSQWRKGWVGIFPLGENQAGVEGETVGGISGGQ